jgi:hypothetical protein
MYRNYPISIMGYLNRMGMEYLYRNNGSQIL